MRLAGRQAGQGKANQGKASQRSAWHGMAWHGRGTARQTGWLAAKRTPEESWQAICVVKHRRAEWRSCATTEVRLKIIGGWGNGVNSPSSPTPLFLFHGRIELINTIKMVLLLGWGVQNWGRYRLREGRLIFPLFSPYFPSRSSSSNDLG